MVRTRLGERFFAGLRAAALGAGVLTLAACSSEGTFQPVYDIATSEFGLGDGEARATPSRADLNAVPAASLSVAIGEAPAAYLFATAQNADLVTFEASNRRNLTVRGSALVATRGFGANLLNVWHHPEDPIAYSRPLSAWPDSVPRTYTVNRFGQEETVRVICRWRIAEPEQIEILEIRYETLRVRESCNSPNTVFENTYWIGRGDGRIWRSVQWSGEDAPVTAMSVIRPFSP